MADAKKELKGLEALAQIIKTKHKAPDIIVDYHRVYKGISSGCLILDDICGGKGIVIQGRITELSGNESSGKSSLCLQTASCAIKQGVAVLYLDFEQTFDANYAKDLGINIDDRHKFLVLQPTTLEEGMKILRAYEDIAEVGETLIIIDSIAAAKPEKLLEQAGEQEQIGLHAQRIGGLAQYLNSVWCGKLKAYVLMVNQIRKSIANSNPYATKAVKGTGAGFGTGDESITTTGGTQLRYLQSIRILLDYAGKIEAGSYSEGNLVREGNYITAKVIKNKVAPPFKSAKIAIIYGKGTDDSFAILETLKRHEYITNSSSMFYYVDSDENEVDTGKGLSFKLKGKEAFFNKLKEPIYQEDMRKTFEKLMSAESQGVKQIEEEAD